MLIKINGIKTNPEKLPVIYTAISQNLAQLMQFKTLRAAQLKENRLGLLMIIVTVKYPPVGSFTKYFERMSLRYV